MYRLTPEGEKYLKNGFPEKNLLREIHEGIHIFGERKKISELTTDNLAVALNWAKKNGWIRIKDGVVELTRDGKRALKEKTDVEIALESVKKTGSADPESVKILIKRKLIEPARKVEVSSEIKQLTPEILLSGAWKKGKFVPYDVEAPAPAVYPGKYQPYRRFIDFFRTRLTEMGFVEVRGEYVELEFWNFDVLFQAQEHPAREVHDTFYIKYPERGRIQDEKLVERVKRVHEDGWITGSTG
ncbi:MAG: phenylalanine--tRNA ligase subunit alpha, partial [Candidatus Micrarchaeota archaeon]|nr:phenylalanine--tRNA ligase subunit alpha [Candidatus Micrarchaeota archaeon]